MKNINNLNLILTSSAISLTNSLPVPNPQAAGFFNSGSESQSPFKILNFEAGKELLEEQNVQDNEHQARTELNKSKKAKRNLPTMRHHGSAFSLITDTDATENLNLVEDENGELPLPSFVPQEVYLESTSFAENQDDDQENSWDNRDFNQFLTAGSDQDLSNDFFTFGDFGLSGGMSFGVPSPLMMNIDNINNMNQESELETTNTNSPFVQVENDFNPPEGVFDFLNSNDNDDSNDSNNTLVHSNSNLSNTTQDLHDLLGNAMTLFSPLSENSSDSSADNYGPIFSPFAAFSTYNPDADQSSDPDIAHYEITPLTVEPDSYRTFENLHQTSYAYDDHHDDHHEPSVNDLENSFKSEPLQAPQFDYNEALQNAIEDLQSMTQNEFSDVSGSSYSLPNPPQMVSTSQNMVSLPQPPNQNMQVHSSYQVPQMQLHQQVMPQMQIQQQAMPVQSMPQMQVQQHAMPMQVQQPVMQQMQVQQPVMQQMPQMQVQQPVMQQMPIQQPVVPQMHVQPAAVPQIQQHTAIAVPQMQYHAPVQPQIHHQVVQQVHSPVIIPQTQTVHYQPYQAPQEVRIIQQPASVVAASPILPAPLQYNQVITQFTNNNDFDDDFEFEPLQILNEVSGSTGYISSPHSEPESEPEGNLPNLSESNDYNFSPIDEQEFDLLGFNTGHSDRDLELIMHHPEQYIASNHDAILSPATDQKKIIPQQHLVKGKSVITDIDYHTDGNYKMIINLTGNDKITFMNFRAGKCTAGSPGVEFLDEDSYQVGIQIDLDLCQKKCDDDHTHFISAVDPLNIPITVSFDLRQGSDLEPMSTYLIQPNALFYEDYILKLEGNQVSQFAINNQGNIVETVDNLQFTYQTFTNSSYNIKTTTNRYSSEPGLNVKTNGQTNYISLLSENGFTTSKMLPIPEICVVTNDNLRKSNILWDMQNDESACAEDLHYDTEYGVWMFPVELQEGDVLSCNVRLCANVPQNECAHTLQRCRYQKPE